MNQILKKLELLILRHYDNKQFDIMTLNRVSLSRMIINNEGNFAEKVIIITLKRMKLIGMTLSTMTLTRMKPTQQESAE